jgi:Double zinc ribbon
VIGVHDLVHSTGFVVGLDVAVALALVFWLALGFWVYKDARRRIADPFLRLLAAVVGLLPPYIGPVVYLLFRPSDTLEDARCRRAELRALEQQFTGARPTCPVCSSGVEPDYLACPVCTTMLREPCATCNAPLEPLWQICPYCTSPIGPSAADLDAALTAEAKAIALVDDIPLVPQTGPRIADA